MWEGSIVSLFSAPPIIQGRHQLGRDKTNLSLVTQFLDFGQLGGHRVLHLAAPRTIPFPA